MNTISEMVWILALLSLLQQVAAGQPLRTATEGTFGFRASVEGERFEARFGDYTVVPKLDGARQPLGFAVEIPLNGVDSGNADRDAEMQLPEWFDSAAYPVASFHAAVIRAEGQGRHIAQGQLQIKGARRSVEVPFFWGVDGGRLELRGEVVLDRRWFDVGPEDDSSVAARVTVFFDLAWNTDEI